MPMSRSEALEAIVQIKELSKGFGSPNEQSRTKMIRLIGRLRFDGPDDDNYRDKLSSVEELADIGFSTRKYEKYPGGVSQVRG